MRKGGEGERRGGLQNFKEGKVGKGLMEGVVKRGREW